MGRRILVCIVILLSSFSLSYAESDLNEMAVIHQQAREERQKEQQIQMLRLELERLKLEIETRRTIAGMGISGDSTLSGVVPGPVVAVRNILSSPSGAQAVLEINGSRRSVKAGDQAGPYVVRGISGRELILADEAGVESKVGPRS